MPSALIAGCIVLIRLDAVAALARSPQPRRRGAVVPHERPAAPAFGGALTVVGTGRIGFARSLSCNLA